MQLPALVDREDIFRDYAFFSGQSNAWVHHCAAYADKMLDAHDVRRVLEIASNDGTLLAEFQDRHVQVLGVEPARNVAWHAQTFTGVPTIPEFFGVALAGKLQAAGYRPDLIVANNVLAHVPDLDDFLLGIWLLLGDEGVVTFEVPHLARMIEDDQIGQIYHEHLSYFGFITLQRCLYKRDLRIFDVEEIPVHGGSLRVHVCRTGSRTHSTHGNVTHMSRWEAGNDPTDRRDGNRSYWNLDTLAAFGIRARRTKRMALASLLEAGPVVGYGAPAKANTFINYLGLGPETISYVVDSTPAKQGTYLPGSRIPVLAPEVLTERRPETILIMAPNWEAEMREKIARDCDWNPTVLCEPWKATVTA